jgi:hypothetical protein
MHLIYKKKEHDVLYLKVYMKVMPFSKWLLSAIDCVHVCKLLYTNMYLTIIHFEINTCGSLFIINKKFYD